MRKRLVALAMCAVVRVAAAPLVVDEVDMAVPASRAAHAVRVRGGTVRRETAEVGTLRLPVAGVYLPAGASLTARVRPGAWLWITLASAPADYGLRQACTILLDGREAARFTERDAGGGVSRSIFLQQRRATLVTVRSDAGAEAPVTVAALRVCAGLPARTPPMGLALLTRQGYGYQMDDAEARDMIARVPRSPHLVRQTAILYNFCNRPPADNAAEVRRVAQQAERLGIPVRLACQVHWAGAATEMPDGLGGRLGDLAYQQIVWDEADRTDDPGLRALLGAAWDIRYGLTTPNAFGNTPWLTFDNPRLNRLRDARLTETLRVWRGERDRLAALGKADLLPMELGTGEETIYWAKGMPDDPYTRANGGAPRLNMAGDFNPATVEAARNDGVALDPSDGISIAERWWLHQALARQQQRLIDAMLAANPPEAVRVRSGRSEYAPDLVRRNLYTEPYAMPYYPMKDASPYHPQIEVGYVRNGRSGGEYWSGVTMLPWLLKERERGRVALPNLECTGVDSDGLVGCLEAAYAVGARFSTLYNWKWHATIDDLLKTFARAIEAPDGIAFPPGARTEEARPGYPLERNATPGARAFGVNLVLLYPAAPGGRARVTLTNADGASVSVTSVLADGRVRLPTLFPVKPGSPCTVRVEPLGGSMGFRLAEDGSLAVRLLADISHERARSLLVADRQDALDLVSALEAIQRGPRNPESRAALADARETLAARDYAASYSAGIRAEQLTLPSTFRLEPPGGRLGPYPVWVRSASPVTAVMERWTGEAGSLRMQSASSQTVEVEAFGAVQRRWLPGQAVVSLAPAIGVSDDGEKGIPHADGR